MRTADYSYYRGFSLMEIVIALAIVAIVAAIVVPRYTNIKNEAEAATAQQMSSELNNTYANWKVNGGAVTSSATAADILTVLTSIGGSPYPAGNLPDPNSVTETTFASGIRVSASPDMTAGLLQAASAQAQGNPPSIVQAGDYLVAFDSGAEQFKVGPANGSWQFVSAVGAVPFMPTPTQWAAMQVAGTPLMCYMCISPTITLSYFPGQTITSYCYAGGNFYKAVVSLGPAQGPDPYWMYAFVQPGSAVYILQSQ
jgi:prepilin-type N-terminal cleavage/methylation domain-containing protein